MNKIAAFTIAALVAIFSYAPANAVPIDYFFWGTGSGTLDGDEFTDQEFHISIWADTDDIHNPGNVPFLDAIMAEIDIGGFATATFTEIVGMFSNNNLGAIGFTSDSRGDLLDIDNSEGTYDLASNFGPIFDATPFPISIFQFTNISTNLGLLTFTSASDITFEAVLKPVPEPASLALFGFGLLGLGAMRRRGRRTA